jgi:hypothetical protein
MPIRFRFSISDRQTQGKRKKAIPITESVFLRKCDRTYLILFLLPSLWVKEPDWGCQLAIKLLSKNMAVQFTLTRPPEKKQNLSSPYQLKPNKCPLLLVISKGFKSIYVAFGALRLTPNTPYKYLDFFRNQI